MYIFFYLTHYIVGIWLLWISGSSMGNDRRTLPNEIRQRSGPDYHVSFSSVQFRCRPAIPQPRCFRSGNDDILLLRCLVSGDSVRRPRTARDSRKNQGRDRTSFSQEILITEISFFQIKSIVQMWHLLFYPTVLSYKVLWWL